MTKRPRWFVSHPSGGRAHTPTFFRALETFAQRGTVELVYPPGPTDATRPTRELLASAERMIAEVSIASTGSGIELGWASATHKPIVAFHQGTSPASPIIKLVTDDIHPYLMEEDILGVLEGLEQNS